jgi:putative flippase GtrA
MNPKVAAGGAAGAVTVILVFVLSQAGVELPPEVSSAVTVLLSTLAGYFKVE